ncbi:hypothetical protein QBC42DRAFT_269773 [Cladorrhinum samala]|uniref:Secreted protein n=1 Tax=Cladorrhinum samala TaxID=585594 RepID=A0AAV9HLK6_9PEZI|nr:hypothetical protein QBC42DRAFT_269773 [Cladorrhinum samala]
MGSSMLLLFVLVCERVTGVAVIISPVEQGMHMGQGSFVRGEQLGSRSWGITPISRHQSTSSELQKLRVVEGWAPTASPKYQNARK